LGKDDPAIPQELARLQLIVQHDLAIPAKSIRLAIYITNAAAVVHQTLIILAVLQIEGVTEFMGGFLDDSREVEIALIAPRNAARQTVRRNDTADPSQLRLAIHMGQDGYKKVFSGQGDDLENIIRDVLR